MKQAWTDSGATISETGAYRYTLWRTWDESKGRVAFCMLNPSTADATQEDPTIRRCIGFARAWGFGGISIVNLFALRSTSPRSLYRADGPGPVGPYNNSYLLASCMISRLVVAAWGVHGAHLGRGAEVRRMLSTCRPHHLELTKDGHPKHPLYLPASTVPAEWL